MRTVAALTGAFVVSFAVALLLFSSTWSHPASAWIGDGRDPHLFIWYLSWTPRQLAMLHNPFFTTDIDYPVGANLMWNTAIFVPSTLLWPVTAAFGAVVSYNVMATAAVAVSAWCAYLAARRLLDSDLGAVVTGLIYGFSPYMVSESMRHPHATIAVFPPLVLMLLHEILVRRKRSAVVLGCLLGLASAAQLLTGEEMLAATALVAGIGVVLLGLLHPKEVRARAPRALAALAAAAVTFALIAGYPLLFQFFGPQRVSGLMQPPNTYVSDALAFVVPPRTVLMSTTASIDVTGAFTGNASENGAYVGVPLILLLAAAVVLGRRRAVVRWAALLTVVVSLLSLGPRLHVGGEVTSIPLPWAAIGSLALLQNMLPARLMLFAFLPIGLILGDLMAAAARVGLRRSALAAAAVAVALLPLVPRLPFTTTDAQAPVFFKAGGDVERIEPGGVVLVTPFSNNHSSAAMYWQAVARFSFRMPEGEAFVPGPYLGPPPSRLQSALDGLDRGEVVPTTAADRAQALAQLSSLGVTTVVAGPSPGHDRVVQYLTTLLGRPPVQSGGVDVWWDVSGAG